MFPERVKRQFLEKLGNICKQRPNITLMQVLIKLRSAPRAADILEQLHYGSYLIESNPGLSQQPLGLWPFLNIKI